MYAANTMKHADDFQYLPFNRVHVGNGEEVARPD
jgi:hypothetical protein